MKFSKRVAGVENLNVLMYFKIDTNILFESINSRVGYSLDK